MGKMMYDTSNYKEVWYEFNIIGWCISDGKKKLLSDTGFTLESEDSTIKKFIEDAKRSCKKKGETFPEFFWNGRSWQEKPNSEEDPTHQDSTGITTRPDRTKGHWIKCPELSDVYFDYYKCSECNRLIKVVRGDSLSRFPFCHCGADMRGEQSNE